MKTYFSTNPSFRLVKTHILYCGNSVLLFGAFFLLLETMIEEINFNRKIFFCYWKPFSIFLQKKKKKKQFFCIVETYFSTNASLQLVETDFLANTNHNKLFFRLVETYFLTNPSLQLLEKDFLFSGNYLPYFRVLFY